MRPRTNHDRPPGLWCVRCVDRLPENNAVKCQDASSQHGFQCSNCVAVQTRCDTFSPTAIPYAVKAVEAAYILANPTGDLVPELAAKSEIIFLPMLAMRIHTTFRGGSLLDELDRMEPRR